MAYCRWSSMNYSCDLYVYEHVDGGWMIHVAGNRVVGEIPPMLPLGEPDVDTWLKKHEEQMKFLQEAEREKIGGPSDQATYGCDTLEEVREHLTRLRSEGYVFPEDLMERIERDNEKTL